MTNINLTNPTSLSVSLAATQAYQPEAAEIGRSWGTDSLATVKTALLNRAIHFAMAAQSEAKNPNALRDLAIEIIRCNLAWHPQASQIAERISVHSRYENYHEHAFGVLAEECAKKGSEGFQIAQQFLAKTTEKRAGYTGTVICLRADERTQSAFTDAVGLYETSQQPLALDSESSPARYCLFYVRGLLQGLLPLEAATQLAANRSFSEQRAQVLGYIAYDEAKKGHFEVAMGIADLIDIDRFANGAMSDIVKIRAESQDPAAIDEAKEFAQGLGPFMPVAKASILVAEAQKGKAVSFNDFAEITDTNDRTDAVYGVAVAKGYPEGIAFLEAALENRTCPYHERDQELLTDRILHVFSQNIGRQGDPAAYSQAKALIGHIQRQLTRDRALRDLAIDHIQRGTVQCTFESLEAIREIRNPAEQSRAFAALALQHIGSGNIPQSDLNNLLAKI